MGGRVEVSSAFVTVPYFPNTSIKATWGIGLWRVTATVLVCSTVTEFSKKTGDYPSLSATDIQVLALTYQLEAEFVGVSHLKQEPEKVPWEAGSVSTANAGRVV